MTRLETLGAVPIAGQPKRVALLTYLAVARPRAEHRRDTLLALLWPELDTDHGRSALRQALHALRRDLGANVLVSTGTESVCLVHDAASCDVWDLEIASAAGDHERVLSLYRGELVPGLFVSDAPAFEHWLDGERERIRGLVRQSAWSTADAALASGDAERALARGRFALSLTSFDETAIRRGMQLFAAAGERAAAIALYERFAAETRAELDADPSAETQSLANEIRHSTTEATARPKKVLNPVPQSRATPPAARRRPARVLLAAIAAVFTVTAAFRIASATGAIDQRRIRVEPFEIFNRSPDLDLVAASAANRVRDALLAVGDARVASGRSTDDRAGTVIRGSLRRSGDTLALRGEVVDRATSTIVRSVTVTGRDADSVTSAFADRINAAVATALYPGWGTALSQPRSYAGYRAFVDGMRSIKAEQHDSAIAELRRAFADSTFTAAGLLAASELYHVKQFAAAESIVVAISQHRATLPPLDARLLDWVDRTLRGDRLGARAAIAGVVALAPTADLAWLELAIESIETARPDEALNALSHIDRDAAFGQDWPAYWATYAEALHVAGDHHRELAMVREGLRRHPETRLLVNYELRALAALGRVREVEAGLRALVPGSGRGIEPAVTARQVAQELTAHGQPAAARGILERLRTTYELRPPTDSAALLGFRLGRARTLYLADDRSGARALYDSLLREHPRCLPCVGALGVLAARDDDRKSARTLVARLAESKEPHAYGRHFLWQSRILSVLGDVDAANKSLTAAFDAGTEYDVMTHADPDLRRLRPDSVYRAFGRADGR